MGFFKPAEDHDGSEESGAADGSDPGDDGATASSSEGEGSDELSDLGVDLDADGGSDPLL